MSHPAVELGCTDGMTCPPAGKDKGSHLHTVHRFHKSKSYLYFSSVNRFKFHRHRFDLAGMIRILISANGFLCFPWSTFFCPWLLCFFLGDWLFSLVWDGTCITHCPLPSPAWCCPCRPYFLGDWSLWHSRVPEGKVLLLGVLIALLLLVVLVPLILVWYPRSMAASRAREKQMTLYLPVQFVAGSAVWGQLGAASIWVCVLNYLKVHSWLFFFFMFKASLLTLLVMKCALEFLVSDLSSSWSWVPHGCPQLPTAAFVPWAHL